MKTIARLGKSSKKLKLCTSFLSYSPLSDLVVTCGDIWIWLPSSYAFEYKQSGRFEKLLPYCLFIFSAIYLFANSVLSILGLLCLFQLIHEVYQWHRSIRIFNREFDFSANLRFGIVGRAVIIDDCPP